MSVLRLRKIGNSVGAVFPQELLARLHLQSGDTVHITDAPGGARLTVYDPEFERQMEAARAVMKKRRNLLHELAK